MIFGHNSNVAIGSDTVHVQTEDRGVSHAIIETTVHWKGRVLHRLTNNYKDLLPLDSRKEAALKTRVDDQHRAAVEAIRSGALKLTFPDIQTRGTAQSAAKQPVATLKIELTNAHTWLSGRKANLRVVVKDSSGKPMASATTKARVEGAAKPFEFTSQTGTAGTATLQFEMPKLGTNAALVIEAVHDGARGQLRFQLRAKARS